MSASITNAFIQQWSDDVKLAFQQNGTKLLGAVRAHYNVTGTTYNFHKLGSVTANTKSRGAEVTGLDPTSATVAATLADYYAPIYVDKLDELKTNANMRGEYVKSAAAAIGRKVDDVIITAMVAAATTSPTVTGALTQAKVLELLTYMNNSDVEQDDRYLVIGSQQVSDLMGITTLTSKDWEPLRQINEQGFGKLFGFNIIMSTRLPISVKNRTIFAFSKQAVGAAVGQDITTEMNYVPTRVATLVNSFVSLGSVVIEDAGIVKMTCVEP